MLGRSRSEFYIADSESFVKSSHERTNQGGAIDILKEIKSRVGRTVYSVMAGMER